MRASSTLARRGVDEMEIKKELKKIDETTKNTKYIFIFIFILACFSIFLLLAKLYNCLKNTETQITFEAFNIYRRYYYFYSVVFILLWYISILLLKFLVFRKKIK